MLLGYATNAKEKMPLHLVCRQDIDKRHRMTNIK